MTDVIRRQLIRTYAHVTRSGRSQTVVPLAMAIVMTTIFLITFTRCYAANDDKTAAAAKDQDRADGRPVVARIKESLILQIPAAFEPPWMRQKLAGGAEDAIGDHAFAVAHFQLFFPDLGGSPEAYIRPSERTGTAYDPNDFDDEAVDIHIWWPKDPPGVPLEYSKEQWSHLAKGKELEETFGLKCFRLYNGGPAECRSMGDGNGTTAVLLRYGPSTTRILLAQYFSPRYGGILVSWITNAKHLAQWRAIDAHIWQYVDAWNIAASLRDSNAPN